MKAIQKMYKSHSYNIQPPNLQKSLSWCLNSISKLNKYLERFLPTLNRCHSSVHHWGTASTVKVVIYFLFFKAFIYIVKIKLIAKILDYKNLHSPTSRPEFYSPDLMVIHSFRCIHSIRNHLLFTCLYSVYFWREMPCFLFICIPPGTLHVVENKYLWMWFNCEYKVPAVHLSLELTIPMNKLCLLAYISCNSEWIKLQTSYVVVPIR